jgi:uncharacterized coiled-coil protein SlyX
MNHSESGSIIFHLENSELKAAGLEGVHAGRLLLTATVHDADLWNKVLESFSNLRLFKGEELKTTLIHMLQGKTEELEKRVAEQDQAASQEIEVAKHRASLAEAGRVRAEQRVQLLEAKLASQDEALMVLQDWFDRTVSRGTP